MRKSVKRSARDFAFEWTHERTLLSPESNNNFHISWSKSISDLFLMVGFAIITITNVRFVIVHLSHDDTISFTNFKKIGPIGIPSKIVSKASTNNVAPSNYCKLLLLLKLPSVACRPLHGYKKPQEQQRCEFECWSFSGSRHDEERHQVHGSTPLRKRSVQKLFLHGSPSMRG